MFSHNRQATKAPERPSLFRLLFSAVDLILTGIVGTFLFLIGWF